MLTGEQASAKLLVRMADQALYRAEAQRRNRGALHEPELTA